MLKQQSNRAFPNFGRILLHFFHDSILSRFGVSEYPGAVQYSGPLGHLAGAINIALADLPDRLNELDQERNRPMVVCLSNKRSTQPIHLLHDAGFSELLLLRGGMKVWNSARLSVE